MRNIELKNLVSENLKDPDSVEFHNLHTFAQVTVGKNGELWFGSYSLCGQLNAKNGFGGYTGFHNFEASIILNEWGQDQHHDLDEVTFEDNPSYVMMQNANCHDQTTKAE